MWGAATHRKLVAEMEAHGMQIMSQGTIGGLNGLLLAAAKERGLGGLCLLGEIPIYATQMINQVLSRRPDRHAGVEINLAKPTLWPRT